MYCLFDRISAFAEDIREEIREQTAFGIFDARDIADQTQRGSVSDAADYRIQAESLEFFHKWFGADPVVAQEHHGFFSVFVGDVHHLTDDLCHFTALECLEVLVFFAGDPVLVVVITLVDDVFRAERVSRFLLKLLEDVWADRCGIAIPVHIFFPCQFIEDEGELMEESREAEDIDIRMFLNEFPQALHRECMGFRLAYIEGDLMLHAFPGIGHRIVHMYRIPHDISQEAHGIFVKRNGFDGNVSGFFAIAPVRRGDNLSRCPVNDFPPAFDIIAGVWHEHIRVQSFHQVDRKAGSAVRVSMLSV